MKQCLRGPGLRSSAVGVTSKKEEEKAANEPFISKLIKLANMTVHDSYKIMDDTNEGNSPRSASGGTTWADGGWVLSEYLQNLR